MSFPEETLLRSKGAILDPLIKIDLFQPENNQNEQQNLYSI